MAFMWSGCQPPKIADSEWECIRVVYLSHNEDGKLEPRSWCNTEHEILNRLRAEFPNNGKYLSCYKPSGSYNHRVDIKLRGGQWWSLTYKSLYMTNSVIQVVNPSFQQIYNFEHDNSKHFFIALTNEMMCVSGVSVDLFTKFNPNELGDNSAFEFERNFPQSVGSAF